MSWLHKSLALIALAYAIVNSIFVIYHLQSLSLNVSRTPLTNRGDANHFDDQIDGLAWFVHVSDLHFSQFVDLKRPSDFLELCQFINSAVNPQAVIITGDLTDAKNRDKIGKCVEITDTHYTVWKMKTFLSLKKISPNQLFSDLFSKTVTFTNFLPKKV